MSQPLLSPFRLGDLDLSNRVVMAPMTRNRADNPGNLPTALTARYYAQRATFYTGGASGYTDYPDLSAGLLDTPSEHRVAVGERFFETRAETRAGQ